MKTCNIISAVTDTVDLDIFNLCCGIMETYTKAATGGVL